MIAPEAVPVKVRELLERRARERGLTAADLEAAGFALREVAGVGWVAARPYARPDDLPAERWLVLSRTKAEGNLRWAPGAKAKGAVLVLGDPLQASTVLIAEGESDAVRAWGELPKGPAAVVAVPGSGMIDEPTLAGFIGREAWVAVATDGDGPGDACAEACRRALAAAGHRAGAIRRLRPAVPGRREADLRDWLEHLEATGADTAAALERAIVEAPQAEALAPTAPAPVDDARPQAAVLVDLALTAYALGVDTGGDAFAVSRHGPQVALGFRGRGGSLRAALAAAYHEEFDRPPSAAALQAALLVLEGRAEREERTALALRVARPAAERLVIDLGRPDGRVVIVEPGGWRLADVPPDGVIFRRTALTGALPDPVPGGALDELRGLVHVAEEDWPLMLAWLVAALLPDVPAPILTLTGPEGAGKSTAGRMLVGVVDPGPAPLRATPKDGEAWAITAAGSRVVGLDNVGHIPEWLADALCRAATGEGLVRRALFTDSELSVLAFRRAVLLTSIDPGAMAGDLADRLLPVELQRLERPREERELAEAFARAHPAILGGLLDLAAHVLGALPAVRLEAATRMVDAARIMAAVDELLGTAALARYLSAREEATARVLEGDAIGEAVVALMAGRVEWAGEPMELLAALEERVDAEHRGKRWPGNARALSARLGRLERSLREAAGVLVERRQSSARRIIVLRRLEAP